MGVKFLRNRTETIRIKDLEIAVTGLELPYEYYLKRKQKKLEKKGAYKASWKTQKGLLSDPSGPYP